MIFTSRYSNVAPYCKRFVFAYMLTISLSALASGDQKNITMCVEHWPPFMIVEKDKEITQGTWVVLVKKIFDDIPGYSVGFTEINFKRCLVQIKNGAVDGTFSHFKNADRESYMDYTNHLMADRSMVWYSTNNFPNGFTWNSYQDLKRYTIGLVRGEKFNEELNQLFRSGELNIDFAGTFKQNFKKLSLGRIDIIIKNEKVGMAAVDELNLSHTIRAHKKPAFEKYRYISFTKRKDRSQVIKRINQRIEIMKQKGEIRKTLGYAPL